MWVMSIAPPGMKGVATGLMWTLHQLGATLSSQLGAWSRDVAGTYTTITLAGALCAALSLGACLAARHPADASG